MKEKNTVPGCVHSPGHEHLNIRPLQRAVHCHVRHAQQVGDGPDAEFFHDKELEDLTQPRVYFARPPFFPLFTGTAGGRT